MSITWIILILMIALNSLFVWRLLNSTMNNKKDNDRIEKGNPVTIGLFSFFQFLLSSFGISDFATGSIFYSKSGLVRDRDLPGTLNVAAVIPIAMLCIVYVYGAKVDSTTLLFAILCQTLGAFFLPRFVPRMPLSLIRKCLAVGLAVTAARLLLQNFNIVPSGNLDGLEGWKLAVLCGSCFVFGALNNVGIGSFAPTAIVGLSLGLSVNSTFVIMMTAAAFSVPVASMEFIKQGIYSKKIATYTSIFGSFAVLIAVYVIKELDISSLRIILAVLFGSFAILFFIKKRPDLDYGEGESQRGIGLFESHFSLMGVLMLCGEILLISFVFVSNFNDVYVKTMERQLLRYGNELQNSISRLLDEYQKHLEMVEFGAAALVENHATEKEIEEYLSRVASVVTDVGLIFISSENKWNEKDGFWLASQPWGSADRLSDDFNNTARSWYFAAHRAKGNVAFVSPYIDYFSGRMAIDVAKIMQNHRGKEVGVVGETFFVDNLSDKLEGMLAFDASAFIVDTRGIVVLSNDKNKVLEHPFDEDDLEKYIDTVLVKNEFYTTIKGNYFYSSQLTNDWKLVLLIPKSSIENMSNMVITKNFVSPTLVIVFASLVISIILIKTIRNEALQRAIVEKLSFTDSLTNLYNRRAFGDSMTREFSRMMREKNSLSFIIFDADKFKNINDLHGHQVGDDVLKSIGAVLLKSVHRVSDTASRLGGEEFGLLLPGTALEGALVVAEEVRKKVERIEIFNAGGERVPVTISAGVASIVPSAETSSETLYKMTDAKLYEAKEHGRNKVCS